MAKVIASFEIKGTLDNINFYVTADGNIARMKGKTGVTAKQFKENPIFDPIRNHGNEFGHCVKKCTIFRQLASRFNAIAKEGSFAGRANKLLFEILEGDTIAPKGKRTVQQGLKTPNIPLLLLGFESNKLKTLQQLLTIKPDWNPENHTLILRDCTANKNIDWPEEATHVHFAIAQSNWDFENDTFDTNYSEEIIVEKNAKKQTLFFQVQQPKGNNLHITFLSIAFAGQERKKYQLLHRKYNSATIIAVKEFINS